MMRRFCAYVEKVFGLSDSLGWLTDSRKRPRVGLETRTAPTAAPSVMSHARHIGYLGRGRLLVEVQQHGIGVHREVTAEAVVRTLGVRQRSAVSKIGLERKALGKILRGDYLGAKASGRAPGLKADLISGLGHAIILPEPSQCIGAGSGGR